MQRREISGRPLHRYDTSTVQRVMDDDFVLTISDDEAGVPDLDQDSPESPPHRAGKDSNSKKRKRDGATDEAVNGANKKGKSKKQKKSGKGDRDAPVEDGASSTLR